MVRDFSEGIERLISSIGLPIIEFGADKVEKDFELLNMIDVLEDLRKEKDVRVALNERYCIRQALEDSKML